MLQGVEFTLEIKNLALSDSKGHDLEKTIVVRVTAAEQKQVGPSAVFCWLMSEYWCSGSHSPLRATRSFYVALLCPPRASVASLQFSLYTI